MGSLQNQLALDRQEAVSFGCPRYPDRSDAVFVVALLLTCGLSVFIGVAEPLGSYAHDTFFLLENAYRVAQGQIPGRDFSSAWGPIMFLIDATGLYFSKMHPAGLGYANALFGSLLAIWTFLIARSRWPSIYACVVGIYAALLIVAPFPLGLDPLDFGYAMNYNRYGYALFGIIALECAAGASSTQFSALQKTAGAVSTGAALGLLAFLKISYAFVAVPFILILTAAAGRGYLRRFIGLGSSFLLVTFLVLCYLRFDTSDMMTDLAIAAASRRLSLDVLHRLGITDSVQCALFLLFAMDLVCGVGRGVATRERVARLHGALFAVGILVAGYLLLISNQQAAVFPLNGYGAIVLLVAYRPLMTGRLLEWPGLPAQFSWILLMMVCIAPLVLKNCASLAGAASEPWWPERPHAVVLTSSERGVTLHFEASTGQLETETNGTEYVDAVENGMALLRRYTADQDGVLAFDEFNPFNYLLDRPSPTGGFAAAANDYIFSASAHPTTERFFGNTRYVMVRKYKLSSQDSMERDDVDALLRIYGGALKSHFAMIDETQHWTLWRRVDQATGPIPK